MGSLLTKAFKKNLPQKLTVYVAMIIIASLLTVYVLLPMWYEQLSEFWVAILLLFPSFFIGVPFPLLLRIATSFKEKQIISYLLGISSVAGVAASIFAIVISILYGYSYVFLLGLLGYAVLIVMAYRLKKPEIVQL